MKERAFLPDHLWQRIADDLTSSGMPRRRYYRKRLSSIIGDHPMPAEATFKRYMTRLLGPVQTNSVLVRSLTTEQINQALHPTPTATPTTTPTKGKRSTTVCLAFANGTCMQFESFAAEQLALEMQKMAMGAFK